MISKARKRVVGILLLCVLLLPIFLVVMLFHFEGASDNLTGGHSSRALSDFITYIIHERNAPPPFVTVEYTPSNESTMQMPLLALKRVTQWKTRWLTGMSPNGGSLTALPKWSKWFLCSLDVTNNQKAVIIEIPSIYWSHPCMLISKDRRVAVVFPKQEGLTNELPIRIDLKTKQITRMNITVPPSFKWGAGSYGFADISPEGTEFVVASDHSVVISDFDKIVRQISVDNDIWRLEWHKDRNLIVVETMGNQGRYLILNPDKLVEDAYLPPATGTRQTRKEIDWALRPTKGGSWREYCIGWWTHEDGWFYRKRGSEFERVLTQGSTFTNRTIRVEEAANLW